MKWRSPLLSWIFLNYETVVLVLWTRQLCRLNTSLNTAPFRHVQRAALHIVGRLVRNLVLLERGQEPAIWKIRHLQYTGGVKVCSYTVSNKYGEYDITRRALVEQSLHAMGDSMKRCSPLLSLLFLNDETTAILHWRWRCCRINTAVNTTHSGHVWRAPYSLPHLQRAGRPGCSEVFCFVYFWNPGKDMFTEMSCEKERFPRSRAKQMHKF